MAIRRPPLDGRSQAAPALRLPLNPKAGTAASTSSAYSTPTGIARCRFPWPGAARPAPGLPELVRPARRVAGSRPGAVAARRIGRAAADPGPLSAAPTSRPPCCRPGCPAGRWCRRTPTGRSRPNCARATRKNLRHNYEAPPGRACRTRRPSSPTTAPRCSSCSTISSSSRRVKAVARAALERGHPVGRAAARPAGNGDVPAPAQRGRRRALPRRAEGIDGPVAAHHPRLPGLLLQAHAHRLFRRLSRSAAAPGLRRVHGDVPGGGGGRAPPADLLRPDRGRPAAADAAAVARGRRAGQRAGGRRGLDASPRRSNSS